MASIDQIRQRINERDYYLSTHAEEEMAEDRLERADVENAIRKGRIESRLRSDPRGTRYRLEGPSLDGRTIQAICRFKEGQGLLIITVYELTR